MVCTQFPFSHRKSQNNRNSKNRPCLYYCTVYSRSPLTFFRSSTAQLSLTNVKFSFSQWCISYLSRVFGTTIENAARTAVAAAENAAHTAVAAENAVCTAAVAAESAACTAVVAAVAETNVTNVFVSAVIG